MTAAEAGLHEAMKDLAIHNALEAVWSAARDANQYFADAAPWSVRKTDPARADAILHLTIEAIRRIAIMARWAIPDGADRLLDLLGQDAAAAELRRAGRAGGGGHRAAGAERGIPAAGTDGGLMFADSHCHLNYKGLAEQQPEILARARARGVSAMLNISTRESEWDAVIGTAEREPDVWATVGIHPHEADQHPDVGAIRLIQGAQHPRVVGIGESGLDYYYDHSDRDRQRASFRAHIAAARFTGLPIVVHTRDAEEDTAAILRDEMGKGPFSGVIHCFTASGAFADIALDLGLYISISGIVTFKNARDLQETAARLPIERLLIETDAPFLAPVPNRGKTGEPAFVADTAEFLAKLRGEEVSVLAETTAANFHTLFAKTAGQARESPDPRVRYLVGRAADRQ